MRSAADEDRFCPTALTEPEFQRWAYRIALRLVNLPPGAPEHVVRRVVFSEGTPGPEWAEALVFMLTMSGRPYQAPTV